MNYLNFIIIFIYGLLVGSFLNCLIWRLYKEESLMGRSYCPKCKSKIVWFDNIPVLSYLFLRGKCRQCKKKISIQYPLIELVTAFLFVFVLFLNNQILIINNQAILNNQLFNIESLLLLKNLVLVCIMIVVFVIDLRWYLILDKVTIPAAIFFFFINILLGVSWISLLVCGAIGAGFFLIQFLVSNGKWIGGGDIRLGLVMGFAFGRLDLLILAMMLAYFIGSFIGVGLMIAGKKSMSSKLPLGVFLSVATLITLFYGENILEWYFMFFR